MLENVNRTIGIWGDSILKGVVFDDLRLRYAMLKDNCIQIASRTLGVSVINRSRFGSTVDKGRMMLEKALDKGLDCDAVLLEYGGNDCDFEWKAVSEDPDAPHRPHTELPVFEGELRTMAGLLREHGIVPVMMSLPPIHGERYLDFLIQQQNLDRDNMLRFLGDARTIYQHQEAYSLAVTRIAADLQCDYLPVRENFLTTRKSADLMCSDGIHPNEAGHRLMQGVLTQYAQSYPNLTATHA